MKKTIQIVFFSLLSFVLKGQDKIVYEEGKVSYLSSRNVYVKFTSTEKIQAGDTLYKGLNQDLVPVLLVENKSSASTVCQPIGKMQLEVGDLVVARIILRMEKKAEEAKPKAEDKRKIPDAEPVTQRDSTNVSPYREKIRGRLSLATYNTLSATRRTTRMRYALLFRGHNLNDSRFSIDSYVTFRHNSSEWDLIQDNIGNGLKIFSLAVKYDVTEKASFTFGRKINPRFSSVGAIDGLQFEQAVGNFQFGAIAGSRPDFADYSFNFNLLQAGVYVSHIDRNPKIYTQTTLGFMEQRNANNTDRRFMYFQHTSNPLKNLNFFSSFEIDLYEKINNQVNTSPRLTNIYLSSRYRINKAVSLSLSYDNRRNIIFYESYKNFIDQLVELETRQGFRAGLHLRPHKNLTVGLTANTRFQQSKVNPSQNFSATVGMRNIPLINARGTLTATYLNTSFLTSQIYGARFSKTLIPNVLEGELYYRWVNYNYILGVTQVQQHIGGANLSVKVLKKLSLNLFYEGVFEQGNPYHRVNARLIKRF